MESTQGNFGISSNVKVLGSLAHHGIEYVKWALEV